MGNHAQTNIKGGEMIETYSDKEDYQDTITRVWPNYLEYIEHAERWPIDPDVNPDDYSDPYDRGNIGFASRRDSTRLNKFSGGTWDKVLDIAKKGWTKKVKETHTYKDMIVSRLSRQIRKTRWVNDVTGTDLDVGRYFSGVPDCWITPEYRMQKRFAVNVKTGCSKYFLHETIKHI